MRRFSKRGWRGRRWSVERRLRAWWSLLAQGRRRKRAAAGAPPEPAIVLTSDGHGRLAWTLNFTSVYSGMNIYLSADGVTWGGAPFDGGDIAAGGWDCSGAAGYFRVCVGDWDGVDVPPYSNAVYSDGL